MPPHRHHRWTDPTFHRFHHRPGLARLCWQIHDKGLLLLQHQLRRGDHTGIRQNGLLHHDAIDDLKKWTISQLTDLDRGLYQ
jgi:hypothetical protein